MQQGIPADELRQIELALEQGRQVPPFRGLVAIFWGLILAKCVVLQWVIEYYTAPVNGWLYIWLPSVVFAGLCTFFYGRLDLLTFKRAPLTGQMARWVWLGAVGAMLLISIVPLYTDDYSPFVIPALVSVIAGFAFILHGALEQRRLLIGAGVCWWGGSLWLFYRPDLTALPIFAAMILLFQVAPTIHLYLCYRRAEKRQRVHLQSRAVLDRAAGI
ncbi:MAG: hypothetical protein ACFB20_11645 [Opitutales bacterium]